MARTVLIVDDDETLLGSLERALRRDGFRVLVATDAALGLVHAIGHRIDVAVIDLRLPGSSGIDLIRQLKRSRPAIKAVLLSGYLSAIDAFEAARAGADLVVSKPVTARELMRRVDDGMPTSASTWDDTPTLARAEWNHVHGVLADCNNNVSMAARKLVTYRSTLRRILARKAPKR
jgi:two-component system response regulator RegA